MYGDVALVSAATERVLSIGNSTVEQVTSNISSGDFVHHQGSFHNKDLFTAWGCFDERYRIRGDFDLLLQPFMAGHAAYVPGRVVCGSRTGGLSTSAAHLVTLKKETLDILSRRKPGCIPVSVYAQLVLYRFFGVAEALVGRKRALMLADAYRLLRGRKRLYTA